MKLSSNEAKIGLAVIGAVIISILGFRIMKDIPLFSTSTKLISYFPKVNGLTSGKNVYINGVDIGSVKEIQLGENDSVKVILSIDKKLAIPVDSKAMIESTDLLGSKAIVIKKGVSNRYLKNGDRIEGVYDEGLMSEFQEKGLTIGDKVAQVSNNLSQLLNSANNLLSKNFRQNLKVTASNFKTASASMDKLIANKNEDITKSLTHLKNILGNVDTLSASNREKVDSVLTSLQRSSKQLTALSTQLNTTTNRLNQILEKINQGNGSLGKLVNDPSFYNNMDSLSYNLQKLAKHIDENPRKYLRNIKISVF
ncbi:MAG TPA: MlaD family protein [Balneolales bacterium]|nr:MlaD family protein [Balneolales bacterium]